MFIYLTVYYPETLGGGLAAMSTTVTWMSRSIDVRMCYHKWHLVEAVRFILLESQLILSAIKGRWSQVYCPIYNIIFWAYTDSIWFMSNLPSVLFLQTSFLITWDKGYYVNNKVRSLCSINEETISKNPGSNKSFFLRIEHTPDLK